MIKILYANGCSMTEGAELGNLQFKFDEKWYGPNTSRDHEQVTSTHAEYMEMNAWPNLLRGKLQIPKQMNSAKSGSCNRRIVRTAIADVEELCKTYDVSEIFVMIGFTCSDRFEYAYGQGFNQIVPSTVRAKQNRFRTMDKEIQKYLEARIDVGNDSIMELLTQHFIEILMVKQYLEAKGIKYLFSYGLSNIYNREYSKSEIETALNNRELKAMYELLEFNDPKKWAVDVWRPGNFEEYVDRTNAFAFLEYVSKRKMFHMGNGGHPLEHAHEAWASHLNEYIKKNEIL